MISICPQILTTPREKTKTKSLVSAIKKVTKAVRRTWVAFLEKLSRDSSKRNLTSSVSRFSTIL
jgi:hypothetical protein